MSGIRAVHRAGWDDSDQRLRGGAPLPTRGGALLHPPPRGDDVSVRRDAWLHRGRGLRQRHPRRTNPLRASVRRALTSSPVLALATVVVIGQGCYRSHERADPADDAGFPDAEFDDGSSGSSDTNSPPLEVGPSCTSRDTAWPGTCTPEIELECQRIAMDWARGRYGHTRCLSIDLGGGNFSSACSLGDFCVGGGCSCTPTRGCGSGDVCVSDTPDGPTRCVVRCTGR